MHECHVVADEDAGLPDPRQVFHRALRADDPIAPAVEGPRAAKRAVPRAAAGELDRRAWLEHAEEVAAAMAQQIAGRDEVVQALHQSRGRALAVERDDARHLRDGPPIMLDGLEQRWHR